MPATTRTNRGRTDGADRLHAVYLSRDTAESLRRVVEAAMHRERRYETRRGVTTVNPVRFVLSKVLNDLTTALRIQRSVIEFYVSEGMLRRLRRLAQGAGSWDAADAIGAVLGGGE